MSSIPAGTTTTTDATGITNIDGDGKPPVLLAPNVGAGGMKLQALACIYKASPTAEPVLGVLVRPFDDGTLPLATTHVPQQQRGGTPRSPDGPNAIPTDPRPSSAIPSPPRRYPQNHPPTPSYVGVGAIPRTSNGRLLLPSPAPSGPNNHHHAVFEMGLLQGGGGQGGGPVLGQFQVLTQPPASSAAHHGGMPPGQGIFFNGGVPGGGPNTVVATTHPDVPGPTIAEGPPPPSATAIAGTRENPSVFIPATTITNYERSRASGGGGNQQHNQQQQHQQQSAGVVNSGAPVPPGPSGYTTNVPPGISNSNSYETHNNVVRMYGTTTEHPNPSPVTTAATPTSSYGAYSGYNHVATSQQQDLPKDLDNLYPDPGGDDFLQASGFLEHSWSDPVTYGWTNDGSTSSGQAGTAGSADMHGQQQHCTSMAAADQSLFPPATPGTSSYASLSGQSDVRYRTLDGNQQHGHHGGESSGEMTYLDLTNSRPNCTYHPSQLQQQQQAPPQQQLYEAVHNANAPPGGSPDSGIQSVGGSPAQVPQASPYGSSPGHAPSPRFYPAPYMATQGYAPYRNNSFDPLGGSSAPSSSSYRPQVMGLIAGGAPQPCPTQGALALAVHSPRLMPPTPANNSSSASSGQPNFDPVSDPEISPLGRSTRSSDRRATQESSRKSRSKSSRRSDRPVPQQKDAATARPPDLVSDTLRPSPSSRGKKHAPDPVPPMRSMDPEFSDMPILVPEKEPPRLGHSPDLDRMDSPPPQPSPPPPLDLTSTVGEFGEKVNALCEDLIRTDKGCDSPAVSDLPTLTAPSPPKPESSSVVMEDIVDGNAPVSVVSEEPDVVVAAAEVGTVAVEEPAEPAPKTPQVSPVLKAQPIPNKSWINDFLSSLSQENLNEISVFLQQRMHSANAPSDDDQHQMQDVPSAKGILVDMMSKSVEKSILSVDGLQSYRSKGRFAEGSTPQNIQGTPSLNSPLHCSTESPMSSTMTPHSGYVSDTSSVASTSKQPADARSSSDGRKAKAYAKMKRYEIESSRQMREERARRRSAQSAQLAEDMTRLVTKLAAFPSIAGHYVPRHRYNSMFDLDSVKRKLVEYKERCEAERLAQEAEAQRERECQAAALENVRSKDKERLVVKLSVNSVAMNTSTSGHKHKKKKRDGSKHETPEKNETALLSIPESAPPSTPEVEETQHDLLASEKSTSIIKLPPLATFLLRPPRPPADHNLDAEESDDASSEHNLKTTLEKVTKSDRLKQVDGPLHIDCPPPTFDWPAAKSSGSTFSSSGGGSGGQKLVEICENRESNRISLKFKLSLIRSRGGGGGNPSAASCALVSPTQTQRCTSSQSTLAANRISQKYKRKRQITTAGDGGVLLCSPIPRSSTAAASSAVTTTALPLKKRCLASPEFYPPKLRILSPRPPLNYVQRTLSSRHTQGHCGKLAITGSTKYGSSDLVIPSKKFLKAGLNSRQDANARKVHDKPVTTNHLNGFVKSTSFDQRNTLSDFQLPYPLFWEYNNQRGPFWSERYRFSDPSARYKALKSNRYAADVRVAVSRVPVCSCRVPPNGDSNVIGCGEDCLNRMMYTECSATRCPLGERCGNQQFQRHAWSLGLEKFDTEVRGWGVRSSGPIKHGALIAEYTGEVITLDTFWWRMQNWYRDCAHHYALALDAGLVIDAYHCGSIARFVNHSCQPNCHMQKWKVNGLSRMGIFALRNIQPGEELCYDYNFHSFSSMPSGTDILRLVTGVRGPHPLVKPLSHRERTCVRRQSIFLLRTLDRLRQRFADSGQQQHEEEDPEKRRAELIMSQLTALKTARSVRTRHLADSETEKLVHVARLAQVLHRVWEALVETAKGFITDSKADIASAPFMSLPSRKRVPAYYDLISEPIDLPTIERNILSGAYTDPSAFDADVRRLVKNAGRFYAPESKLYRCAWRLGQVYITQLQDIAEQLTDVLCFPLEKSFLSGPILAPPPVKKQRQDPCLGAIPQGSQGDSSSAIEGAKSLSCQSTSESSQSLTVTSISPGGTKRQKVEVVSDDLIIPTIDGDPRQYPGLPAAAAGGETDEVRCICGLFEDDGTMAQCDSCHYWQHADCMAFDPSVALPDAEYLCHVCDRTRPVCRSVKLTPQPEFRYEGCTYYRTLMLHDRMQARICECVYVKKQISQRHKQALKSLNQKCTAAASTSTSAGQDANKDLAQLAPALRPDALKETYSEDELRIFKIERLFTSPSGESFVFGSYYARPEEVFCVATRRFHRKEVFETPFFDTLPMESIIARCMVLDPATYCRGRPKHPHYRERDVYFSEYRIDKTQHLYDKVKATVGTGRKKGAPAKGPTPRSAAINTASYVFESFFERIKIKRDWTPFDIPPEYLNPKSVGGPSAASPRGGHVSPRVKYESKSTTVVVKDEPCQPVDDQTDQLSIDVDTSAAAPSIDGIDRIDPSVDPEVKREHLSDVVLDEKRPKRKRKRRKTVDDEIRAFVASAGEEPMSSQESHDASRTDKRKVRKMIGPVEKELTNGSPGPQICDPTESGEVVEIVCDESSGRDSVILSSVLKGKRDALNEEERKTNRLEHVLNKLAKSHAN